MVCIPEVQLGKKLWIPVWAQKRRRWAVRGICFWQWFHSMHGNLYRDKVFYLSCQQQKRILHLRLTKMIPAVKESCIYVSIANLSGRDRLYRQLEGNGAPGRRSVAQSYGLCGGRERALSLLNTELKSWYSTGTLERSTGSSGWGLGWLVTGDAEWRRGQTMQAPTLYSLTCPVYMRVMDGEPRETQNYGIIGNWEQIELQTLAMVTRNN